jgi:hypothetical protein
MVDQDHSSLQKIEEKLKKLENSPETLEKVSTFLKNKENANCLHILESVVDIDKVFQGLVNRLVEKINNPEAEKDEFGSDRSRNADGINFVVPDCSRKSENVSQSWFSTETVTRLGGEIGGALIGTALLPVKIGGALIGTATAHFFDQPFSANMAESRAVLRQTEIRWILVASITVAVKVVALVLLNTIRVERLILFVNS